MHIVIWTRAKRFADTHVQADRALRVWRTVMRRHQLGSHRELQMVWPQTKVLNARRVIFRIGGHRFRLIADVHYDLGRIYIRWIGTHEEYNAINAEEI